MNVLAVSYTHLDVYKRQALNYPTEVADVLQTAMNDSYEPVSYTHLDVYKRQSMMPMVIKLLILDRKT